MSNFTNIEQKIQDMKNNVLKQTELMEEETIQELEKSKKNLIKKINIENNLLVQEIEEVRITHNIQITKILFKVMGLILVGIITATTIQTLTMRRVQLPSTSIQGKSYYVIKADKLLETQDPNIYYILKE